VSACGVAGLIHCYDVEISGHYVWGSGRDIGVIGFCFYDCSSNMGQCVCVCVASSVGFVAWRLSFGVGFGGSGILDGGRVIQYCACVLFGWLELTVTVAVVELRS
jgi:hypothetical protein